MDKKSTQHTIWNTFHSELNLNDLLWIFAHATFLGVNDKWQFLIKAEPLISHKIRLRQNSIRRNISSFEKIKSKNSSGIKGPYLLRGQRVNLMMDNPWPLLQLQVVPFHKCYLTHYGLVRYGRLTQFQIDLPQRKYVYFDSRLTIDWSLWSIISHHYFG